MVAFSELSVSTSDPEIVPVVVGEKLTEYTQEAPAASAPGLDDALRTGQVVKLPRLKLEVMLGLFPEVGVGKMSVPVPLF